MLRYLALLPLQQQVMLALLEQRQLGWEVQQLSPCAHLQTQRPGQCAAKQRPSVQLTL
jgi:hypothetical protein